MDAKLLNVMPRQVRGFIGALAVGLTLFSGLCQAQAERIVSLDLCMDWAVAEFTEAPRIAALSPWHLRYPIPTLKGRWPSHNGSLEEVVSHKPDLVLVGQYSAKAMRERLQGLGVRVEVLALPSTLADVERYERTLRTHLNTQPEKTHLAPVFRPPNADAPRLLLLGANALGTGRDTLEHQILEQAGWRNYVQESGHVALDLEELASDPPEAILFTAPTHPALAYRFAEHPVLQKHIHTQWLTTDYWRWQCPGPWTWDLIRQLNEWLDTQPQA